MAAARRRGTWATGPPSWKISSVRTAILRIGNSGMGDFLKFVLVRRSECDGAADASLPAKEQRRSGDHSAPAKIFGDGEAVVQLPRDLIGSEHAAALCHQARAK